MSNEVDFDCDAAVSALSFNLEELSLRQQRDADYEKEVDSLERKKFRLEARLRAIDLKVEQLRRDAARQESAILRELEREAESLTQEVSKVREEARALERQCSQIEAKCDALEKQNAELGSAAAELERRVEELKSQDSSGVAEGFKMRKLLQEFRFEVAQLEQEQRELYEAERQSMTRVESLLTERLRRVDLTRRLEADNDALRLALIEARSRSACGPPGPRRASRRPVKEGGAATGKADFRVGGVDGDDNQRQSLQEIHQRLWDDIVRWRGEFAALLKRVRCRDTRNAAVQTDREPNENRPEQAAP
ncbi:ribonuclease Y-like [Dermacentor albipictus]|uniref:ribonuclease Y-like n=1 Tax=Dermacentor albipictus TaxID=60249 RepID=UPI0031FC3945